ncbi:MAG: YegS/Rv2252/BmrU family lipid kinase [Ginsengibacter sp.]
MNRKFLFFINPISGTKSKLHLVEKITKVCEEENQAFEILPTSKEGDYRFLPNKIDNDHITDVIICGGDGSLSPIISATLHKPVQIGIIPLGSGNGVARTAGIPQSVDRALKTIMQGKAHYVDAFLINDTFSSHVCGLGFDAKVAHDFSKVKKRGAKSYGKLILKNFLSAKFYPFTIELNEKNFHTDAFLICIANSNQFGNNLKIAPRASLSDGLLDIVILKRTSKLQILVSFAKQILQGKVKDIQAKNFQQKDILYFQTAKIKIQNPQKALLHIDGDPAPTAEKFLIEILPSAYKLIQP